MFSVKRLAEFLAIDMELAKKVRAVLELRLERGVASEWEEKYSMPDYVLQHSSPSRKLRIVNEILRGYGFHGVEGLDSNDDTFAKFAGVEYLNAGDTYAGTLMYDFKKGKFLLTDLGTLIERQPNRFV